MRRLLSYITLLIMMATSVVTGQWNEWSRRPDWSHLMRHLVPQDNLALFVNPGAQMIDGAKGNSQYPALKTSEEIVQNADFHDFTIDYPSIGEPDPFYESDFSVDEDGWSAYAGTVVGNVDGIDGKDDVLKFWANSDNTSHFPYTWNDADQTRIPPHTIVRVTGKVFIPSGQTNVDGFRIGTTRGIITREVKISTTDTWVDFDAEINNNTDVYALIRFYETTGSTADNTFTGADDPNDDIIYLKDVKFQRVGLVAWWQFDSYYHAQEGTGKTILQDLSGNGYDLTASGGFDYTNQMTGDDPTYKNGNAVEFDGVDDKFVTNHGNSSLAGANNFSVFGLIKQNADGGIYENGSYKANGFRLYCSSTTKYFSAQFYDSSGTITTLSYPSYQLYSWTYFCITGSDNGDGTIYAKVYIDGQLVVENASVHYTPISSTRYDMIGYINGGLFYNGNISVIATFNRTLSATEVKALYGKPKHWTWNETGSITNNNFKTELSGGAELSQDITTDDETLYKEQKISTTDNDVDYFGNTTSHTITIGDGTWTYAGVKDVTNVSAPNSTTVIDYSGNGNNGMAQGGLETNQPVHPYAWEFDGVDDYVDFGDVFNIKDHSAIIPFWFKTSSTKTYLPLFGKSESATSNGFTFYLSAGYFRLNVGDGTNSTSHYFDSIDHRDGEWYFGTLIYDSQNTKWLVYLDAEFVGDWVSPYTYFENTDHFRVGKFWGDLYEGQLSLLPYYLFDGQDGRASVMPSNYYQRYIQKIYNNTRRYFQ